MTTATAPKKIRITERCRLTEAARVEGNVIRGVVLLGLSSKNGHTYDEGAVREAVTRGLYTGLQIYADHVTEAEERARDGVRTLRDLIGVTENATFQGGKVIGDVRVVRTDPMGAKLLEMAADPVLSKVIGMSHDAVGKIEERDGRKVITALDSVESADVVTRPATTSHLFESHRRTETVMGAFKSLLESKVKFRPYREADEMEGEVVGEMVQVRTADGQIHHVSKEMCSPMEEPGEDGKEAEGEEPDDKEEPVADKKPETKESARERALAAENAQLKERVAKQETRDLVDRKVARLPEAIAAVVRDEFKDRTASEADIDAFITKAKRIAEATAKDTGTGEDGERPSVSGWAYDGQQKDGEDDATLLQEAFPALKRHTAAAK